MYSGEAEKSEWCLGLAVFLLRDCGKDITHANLSKIMEASGNAVDNQYTTAYEAIFKNSLNMDSVMDNAGVNGPPTDVSALAAPKKEEKAEEGEAEKEEEEEESEGGGLGIFGGGSDSD